MYSVVSRMTYLSGQVRPFLIIGRRKAGERERGHKELAFKSVVKDLLFFFGPSSPTLRRTYSYIYTQLPTDVWAHIITFTKLAHYR